MAEENKKEDNFTYIWKILGGTILSVTVLLFLTLFNIISNNISDVKNSVQNVISQDLPQIKERLVKIEEQYNVLKKQQDGVETNIKNNDQSQKIADIIAFKDNVKEKLDGFDISYKELLKQLQELREKVLTTPKDKS